jgi:glycerol uptake facilitator-like aquaporin
MTPARRLASELLGTALLLAAVVGSGITSALGKSDLRFSDQ